MANDIDDMRQLLQRWVSLYDSDLSDEWWAVQGNESPDVLTATGVECLRLVKETEALLGIASERPTVQSHEGVI